MAETFFFALLLPLLVLSFFLFGKKSRKSSSSDSPVIPKSYPVIGSFIEFFKNRDRFVQWTAEIVNSTPTNTYNLHRAMGQSLVLTADPRNVHHILKSHFHVYEKGDHFKTTLRDLLGDGIFNADGEVWKFQRQIASHEFNTRSLRKFVDTVVDAELADRLLPILRTAAAEKTVLDFQDILQRFAFDNICKIAFGYDPEYLTPALPQAEFAVAFETAVRLSRERFATFLPVFWKLRRAMNFGKSEKELKSAVSHVQNLAGEIIRRKKNQPGKIDDGSDLLSRFLSSGHTDEVMLMDIVISFILAGRDTTSAVLTWFFWVLSKHPHVESAILEEINSKASESTAYDEAKEMVYTHASISESMRLYPPVPIDAKCAVADDVLPDGTVMKKGMRIAYHPYAMGRVEKIWGSDWPEYRPERWLQKSPESDRLKFVNKDPYTYPVFQAGPRICLGKDLAYVQMKSLVAGVLREFRIIPVESETEYVSFLTAKMKGGFPVRVVARNPTIN